MSIRRIHRSDTSQQAIVEALRAAGVQVWVIGRPCDLLTLYAGRWLPLECKSPTPSGKTPKRKDQVSQNEFLALTGVPVVGTPQAALEAVGVK